MPEEASWGFPNAATPPGSAYYYVARFSERRRRDATAAWLAWFSHIDRIAVQARDPGVSRLKLDWWREEAGLALQDRARHPIARALSTELVGEWQVTQMHRALDGIEQRILRRRPRDRHEFFVFGETAWGSRMALLGRADNDDLRRLAYAAGRYCATVEQLQYLGRAVHRDHLPLPAEADDTQDLTLARLRTQEDLPELTRLGESLLSDAERAWREVRAQARACPALDPVLRLSAQAGRSARLLRRHAFQTHNLTPQPTPIGLLWSAWRGR